MEDIRPGRAGVRALLLGQNGDTRDDFRIENNPALSFATQKHENVIALFIYNNKNFSINLSKFFCSCHFLFDCFSPASSWWRTGFNGTG